MEKYFQIHVFGKAGCEKCAVLNKRLDQLLTEEEWQAFEKVYHDVETVEGLVAFSRMECMNPSSIPGFVINRKNPSSGEFHPLPRLLPVAAATAEEKSLLYSWHGVQTDYGEAGKGIIPPALIRSMLEKALQSKPE